MTHREQIPANTDLGDVPPEWLDPETLPEAGILQELADEGALPEDSDGDGITDLGELRIGSDPLDPENRQLPIHHQGVTLDYIDDVEDLV